MKVMFHCLYEKLTERESIDLKNAVQFTKCFIEGSIFNAHSIARSHLSSRCNTATRCIETNLRGRAKKIKTYKRNIKDLMNTSFIKISLYEYINLKRGSNISSRTSILVTCTRNGNFSITAHSPYTSKSGQEIGRE